MSAKQIRSWIRQLNRNDEPQQLAAMDRLARFGPLAFEAVPKLTELVGHHNDCIAYRSLQALARIGPASAASLETVTGSLGHSSPSTRKVAFSVVQAIGPVSIPELVHTVLYGSDDGKVHAIRALGALGHEARVAQPILTHMLETGKPNVRRAAASALVSLDMPTKEIVKSAVELFKSLETPQKLALLETLWRWPEITKLAIPNLKKILTKEPKSGDDDHRKRVLRLIPRMGKVAEPLVDSLLPFFEGPENPLRSAAIIAVARIGAPIAIPPLMKLLAIAGDVRKQQLIDALSRFGPAAADVVPVIAQALTMAYGSMRETLLDSLVRLGTAATPAIPAVVALLNDPNAPVRAMALQTLTKLGLPAEAIPAIQPLLRDQDPAMRLAAITALGQAKLPLAEIQPTLIERLSDDSSAVRDAAARAIAARGEIPPSLIDQMTSQLTSTYAEPRLEAATWRWRFTQELEPSLPAFRAALKSSDRGIRRATVKLLREIADSNPAVIPVLVEALGNPDEPDGRPAATALISLAKKAIPFVVAGLEAPFLAVQTGCVGVLVRLRFNQTAIRMKMTEFVDGDEPELRWAAGRYFAELGIPESGWSTLVRLLDDDSKLVRGWATLTLASIGEPIVTTLLPVLAKGKPATQIAVCDTLMRIGPPAKAALFPLAAILCDPDQPAREQAILALREIARDVMRELSPLMQLLEANEPELREWAALCLAERGESVMPLLLERLARGGRDEVSVLLALRQLGSLASPATAMLVERLRRNENLSDDILATLVSIGKSAVPGILTATQSKSRSVQLAAIAALGRLGKDAEAAIPDLITQLSEAENGTLARFLTETIGLIGPDAVNALATAAQKASITVQRARLIHALGSMGQTATPSISILTIAVNDPEPSIALEATWALGRVPIDTKTIAEVSSSILQRIDDVNPAIAQQAAITLGRIAKLDPSLLDRLFERLSAATASQLPSMLLAVRETLSAQSEKSTTPLPPKADQVLQKSLETATDPDTRRLAAQVITLSMARSPKSLTPVVESLVADPSIAVRMTVLEALGSVGKMGIPMLQAAWSDPLAVIRRTAFRTLRSVLPAAEFEPILRSALEDSDPLLINEAIEGLRHDAASAKMMVPRLLDCLRSPFQVVRNRSLEVLQEQKIEASQIVSAMCQALVEPSADVRNWATERIGNFGAVAAEAVPLLSAIMATGTGYRAAHAIRSIGRAAVPGLKMMLRHPIEKVRLGVVDHISWLDWQLGNTLRPFRKQFGNPSADVIEQVDAAFELWSPQGAGSSATPTEAIATLKNNSSWYMRQAAADSLLAFAQQDKITEEFIKDTLEALEKGIKDNDNDVREHTLRVVVQLGDRAASLVEIVVDALTDSHPRVRGAAIQALSKLNATDKISVAKLIPLLNPKKAEVDTIKVICEIVDSMGKIPDKISERLIKLIKSDDAIIRTAVLPPLAKVGGQTKLLRPIIEMSLKAADPREQIAAVIASLRIENDTALVMPTVIKLLGCRMHAVRDKIAEIAQLLGERGTPHWQAASVDLNPRVRIGLIHMLAVWKDYSKSLAPLVSRLAEDANADVRKAVQTMDQPETAKVVSRNINDDDDMDIDDDMDDDD